MRKSLLVLSCLSLSLMLGAGSSFASPSTFGFDTLTPFTTPPSGYAGITTWNGSFQVVNDTCCGASGYANGNVSPNNEIYDLGGLPAQFGANGDPTFTLDSFFVTASWNDGMNLSIIGLLNGVQVGSDNVNLTINTAGPLFASLNWAGVNEVDFVSSGGVNHGYNGSGTHFVIDDLTVNNTPEPASMVLLGSGILAVANKLRKRA